SKAAVRKSKPRCRSWIDPNNVASIEIVIETLGGARGKQPRRASVIRRLQDRHGAGMTAQLSYIHRFEPGDDPSRPPLLLLHGTGGDEEALLPLGREVAPSAAILSPRGNVLEGGMPRFFRRIREGLFDEDDVRRRANELADFIGEARRAYGIAAPVALG